VALANYAAMSSNELTVRKGELLEMLTDDVPAGSTSSLKYVMMSFIP